ncbi:MAG: branched-chain amino acid ABC transporter permease [Candidatus Dormibacteraeota bacterium]|nr:branched-chain amino acid ABC transporter permease [Candidatus Dormibacteraeota bacterium]
MLSRALLVLVGLAVLAGLLVSARQNSQQFVVVTLNGLTLAGLYFIVAAGFTLIFGLMRVVNMAHGSFYLLAGYLAFTTQAAWFGVTSNLLTGSTVTVISWLVPLLFGTVLVGILGLGIQQLVLRWNQGQDLRQALITIAISVILADQMLAHFGGISQSIQQPTSWPISVAVFGVHYGFFRLVVVMGSALIIGALLWLGIRLTRFGMIVRAGVDDRSMVSALGINVQLVFAGAFLIGSLLAGFGGVLGGTMIAVTPGADANALLTSLIVVIIGGMGSLGGAAIGALALGLVSAYADVYFKLGGTDLTNYAILVTFVLVVVVLSVRPLGLFGRPA